MKYRKKPDIVEATQWFKDGDHEAVIPFPYSSRLVGTHCIDCQQPYTEHGYITTGAMDEWHSSNQVCPGDWILTDVMGKRSVCKPDIFEASYVLAEDDEGRPVPQVIASAELLSKHKPTCLL